jgi:hypothetical protein
MTCVNRITRRGYTVRVSEIAMRFDLRNRRRWPAGWKSGSSTDDIRQAIDEFIRTRGVTRCPTACLAPTQGSVDATDRAALEEHALGREQRRRARAAAQTADQLFDEGRRSLFEFAFRGDTDLPDHPT